MQTNPKPIHFSNIDARRYLLRHHYLLPPKNLSGKEGVMHLLKRLGCIQFDTINVVGRNADLVLQSRLKNYTPKILEDLLYEDRKLIDGWDKVASIYPITDWPYFERHRKHLGQYYQDRAEEPKKMVPHVLEFIKQNGPTSSLEFKGETKTDWAWGPTTVQRATLELLYSQGSVGIHHRVNTRRYFDLIERLIPSKTLNQPDPNKEDADYLEWHILRRVGGIGIASLRSGEHWLGIRGGRKVSQRKSIIPKLVEKQLLLPITIENLENQIFYIRAEDYENNTDWQQKHPKPRASFIAPLDNLIWDRKLLNDIFGFEYIWEVYKPKKKRQYGYYVLPVLYGDQFIARVDFQYDKKAGHLTLNNWWWEDGVKPDKAMKSAILQAFDEFQNYLGAKQFEKNDDFSIF